MNDIEKSYWRKMYKMGHELYANGKKLVVCVYDGDGEPVLDDSFMYARYFADASVEAYRDASMADLL